MASNNKRKMTMAKRNRELGLIERRRAKEAKKAARKLAAESDQAPADDEPVVDADEPPTDPTPPGA